MAAIERQRPADARRLRVERALERPRVEPDDRRIERQLAVGERQRPVDVEQLAQAIEVAVERRLRHVAFRVGPQQRGQHRGVDVSAAVRDQRLQELERLFLRLALRHERLAFAADHELAERAHRDRPRPVGDFRRRRRRAGAGAISVRTKSRSMPCGERQREQRRHARAAPGAGCRGSGARARSSSTRRSSSTAPSLVAVAQRDGRAHAVALEFEVATVDADRQLDGFVVARERGGRSRPDRGT